MWEQQLAFWVIALAMAGAAIGVVRSRNVVHAALFLVVVMAGAAAQYILLVAEFVAWVQVLIYIGAVIILFLFGIMLTRAPMRGEGTALDNDQRWAGAVVSLFLFGVLTASARRRVRERQDQVQRRSRARREAPPTSGPRSSATTSCPFEVVSMLLLAALSAPSSWPGGTDDGAQLLPHPQRVHLLHGHLRRARAPQRHPRAHERRAHAERGQHQPGRLPAFVQSVVGDRSSRCSSSRSPPPRWASASRSCC